MNEIETQFNKIKEIRDILENNLIIKVEENNISH